MCQRRQKLHSILHYNVEVTPPNTCNLKEKIEPWGSHPGWKQTRACDLSLLLLLLSCSAVSTSAAPWTAALQASPSSSISCVCSNSCPSSRWCHWTISSSVIPFSSCLQSLPASESFPMSWLFTSGSHSLLHPLLLFHRQTPPDFCDVIPLLFFAIYPPSHTSLNTILWVFMCLNFIELESYCAYFWAFQVVLEVKNSPAKAGDIRDTGSIPGLGWFPGGGHGNPLQYSCLENPMDRGAWWATVHGVAESDTTEVTEHTCTCIFLWLSSLTSHWLVNFSQFTSLLHTILLFYLQTLLSKDISVVCNFLPPWTVFLL